MSHLTLTELTVGQTPGFVVEHVTAKFEPGELVGIIGPNGAGKSTLAKGILGIRPPLSGQVLLDGKDLRGFDLREKAQHIGYLPQATRFSWRMTVSEAIKLGRYIGKQDADEFEIALRACGLGELRNRNVLTLSGGEQMRVHLARLFYGKHDLLVADEPCASLDIAHQHKVMKLLQAHSTSHASIVVIHDLALAQRYCDRLLLVHKGKLLHDGPVKQVLESDQCAAAFGIEFQTYVSTSKADSQAKLLLPRPSSGDV